MPKSQYQSRNYQYKYHRFDFSGHRFAYIDYNSNVPFRRKLDKLLLPVLLVCFCSLRLFGIFGDFSNSDAWRWHHRSESFYQGLRQGNLKEIYQRYHPGVSLMWLTTGVRVGLQAYTQITHTEYKTLENVEGYVLLDGLCKVAIILVLSSLVIWQVRTLTELYNGTAALLYFLLISFEPFVIGIDRWYHITSLEVYLAFTAFLLTLKWTKSQNTKTLIVAGVFMGLALLTKFSSGVTFLLLLIMVVWQHKNQLRLVLKPVLALVVPALLIILLFFPALWLYPGYVFSKLIEHSQETFGGNYATVVFAQNYPVLYYPVVLLLKLSPIAVILLLVALVSSVSSQKRILFWPVGYILLYLLVFTLADQKIERYAISVMPALLMIIAVALSHLTPKLISVISLIIILTGGAIYLSYFPYPALYYSPAVAGVAGVYKSGLLDTNGEYFSDAARYLNMKGRDVVVHTAANEQSFKPYFKGIYASEYSSQVQYVITSVDSTRGAASFPACPVAEKVFLVDGLAYVTIWSCF
ncbi:MAG: glycosyltransferase family 39 protein [bacterium]